MTADLNKVQTNQPDNDQQSVITDGGQGPVVARKKEISESKIDRVFPVGNDGDPSADQVIEELKDKYFTPGSCKTEEAKKLRVLK